ncbi:hypothetical protein CY0110_18392 [Crocosphaera chwakensis CCY0110]|uniref:Uncharacterized protein n=1 Tax=Crocosphaera chwakensis CCY0110 TaxID=391612 RepID=A3IJ10_9CHRO|nr:hypothetical protein CY0110_18392 [Crocosphaera chwakensis CCY0110]
MKTLDNKVRSHHQSFLDIQESRYKN